MSIGDAWDMTFCLTPAVGPYIFHSLDMPEFHKFSHGRQSARIIRTSAAALAPAY